MASNSFKPTQAVAVTAQLVAEKLRWASLVTMDGTNDLLGGGGKNRSVDIKIPTALVAHARGIDDTTNEIILDTIAESTVSVKTGTHIYSAVPLSEGDLTLDLTSFAAQVLAPQAEAVAASFDYMVEDAFKKETADAGLSTAGQYLPAEPAKFLTKIRKALVKRGVPTVGLKAMVGPGFYADLVDSTTLTDASASGSTAALREAGIGRVRGFDVVENPDLGDFDVFAFHGAAFTLANRAPVAPAGASFAATTSARGVNMRYLRDYDAKVTMDRSIVSTFAGIVKMPLYKIVRTIDLREQGDAAFTVGSASVVEVAGGAIIRATATA